MDSRIKVLSSKAKGIFEQTTEDIKEIFGCRNRLIGVGRFCCEENY